MYSILSLDGGGLKGIYTLKVLEKIENDYNIKIYEKFDMIIGTSTGAIIATLLSMGKSATEVLEIYENCYKEIFEPIYSKNQKGLLNPIYSSEKLENIIKENLKGFDFLNLKTKLIIPSVNLTSAKINIFKNYDYDSKLSLEDAIIASSSAPGAFNPYNVEENLFIDGAIFANNPVLIAFSESIKLGIDINDIQILSIGTGNSDINFSKEYLSNKNLKFILKKYGLGSFTENLILKFLNINEENYSLLSLAFPLLKTTTRTSVENSDYIMSNILSDDKYIRISDFSKNYSIDEIPIELILKIDEDYLKYKDRLNKFLNRKKKNFLKQFIFNISKKLRKFSEN